MAAEATEWFQDLPDFESLLFDMLDAIGHGFSPVIAALDRGHSPDEAMVMLAESYPRLDDGELRQLIAQAIFVADVWGRLNGR